MSHLWGRAYLRVTYELHIYLVGKPRGQLPIPIRHNWTVFANSYGWDVISRNLSKKPRFEKLTIWSRIWDGGGVAHQLLLVTENQGDCPFVWYQNSCSALFGFVTKHGCGRKQTDRRTDRHTELRQLIPRYHSCSRSKNRSTFSVCCLKHIGAGAERNRSGAGQKSGERERSGERVWKTSSS